MLTHLTIKNYALIEHLSLPVGKGLTTITGETGAGKSILLGGLGLVLGQRFDGNALMDDTQKCIIEAVFELSKYDLKSFFEEADLDYEAQTVIRRELTTSGRSRAFVNDTPVTLDVLQTLKSRLIDIHSQHETLQLNEQRFQFQVLDDVSDTVALVLDYQLGKKQYEKAEKDLSNLEQQIVNDKQQYDYHLHLYNELKDLNLEEGQLQALETEQERLSHIELIKASLVGAYEAFSSGEDELTNQIHRAKQYLEKIQSYAPAYLALAERVNSLSVEAEDVFRELTLIVDKEDFSSGNLDEVNAKIHHIQQLFQKHHVGSEAELKAVRIDLETKVQLVTNADEALAKQKEVVEQFRNNLLKQAEKISRQRQKALAGFETKITALLKQLGMPNAVFKVKLMPNQPFNAYGTDDVQWLFSANKGIEPAVLKRVASGGELSRIMLAVKAIWAEKAQLPTIIFDEIDTGISGEVALKMGAILKAMSQHMQVISITHLPQIASKGQQQFKVFKTQNTTHTQTQVKPLNTQERLTEIAEMLGGKTITETALKHAEELLK